MACCAVGGELRADAVGDVPDYSTQVFGKGIKKPGTLGSLTAVKLYGGVFAENFQLYSMAEVNQKPDFLP